MFILSDAYGSSITNGVKVAYNYAGEVRIGKVLEVKESKRYGKVKDWTGAPYVVIHIEMSPTPKEVSKISKVTNPRNLVVIQ